MLYWPGRSGARPLGTFAKIFVAIGTAVLIALAARSYAGTLKNFRKMFGSRPAAVHDSAPRPGS